MECFVYSKRIFLQNDRLFKKGEKKSYRTLECNGFTKRNALYYARYINLEGPGWRTRVAFDADSAELGFYDAKDPVNIMQQSAVKK